MNLGVFFSLDGEELTGVSWNIKKPAGFGHTLSRVFTLSLLLAPLTAEPESEYHVSCSPDNRAQNGWGPGALGTRIHSSGQLGSYQGHQDDNVNKVFGCFWGTQNWPYRFHGKYKSQFVLNRILQRRRQLKAKKIYIKINKTLALFQ